MASRPRGDNGWAVVTWDGGMLTEGTGSRIKGGVLISRLNMLRQHGGQVGVDAVLRRLPAEDQALLRKMLLPVGWYPLELNLRLDAAIAGVMSPEDKDRAFLEMGRASAHEALHGPQHVFVKAGEPHFLLSQAPKIYRFYYAVGSRTYEQTGPCAAVLRTFGAENVTEPDCLTIIGWHERAIELCGGRAVHVTHPMCRARGAPHCEYHCTWE
ncbi:TIGR02265 family protein [Myxococcus xanthus]|nr:TIGR02265 family protein [Myxococcus xanthus]